jgi:hypothetical protein
MHRVSQLIDDAAQLRPSAGEYELAYHARVAIALEGPETAERRFRARPCCIGRSRNGNGAESPKAAGSSPKPRACPAALSSRP